MRSGDLWVNLTPHLTETDQWSFTSRIFTWCEVQNPLYLLQASARCQARYWADLLMYVPLPPLFPFNQKKADQYSKMLLSFQSWTKSKISVMFLSMYRPPVHFKVHTNRQIIYFLYTLQYCRAICTQACRTVSYKRIITHYLPYTSVYHELFHSISGVWNQDIRKVVSRWWFPGSPCQQI
jgi:hypothetical protein